MLIPGVISRFCRRLLYCLLLLLIGVQGTLAFYPGAAGASGGMVVDLCAAGEVRQVVIDPDTGEPVPQEHDTATCAFCIMPAFVAATPSVGMPKTVPFSVSIDVAPATSFPASPQLASCIRAPPFVTL